MLEHISFSTSEFKPHEQFDAYRNFLGTAADVTPDHSTASGFAASATAWNLGGMAFIHAILPGSERPRSVHRNRKDPVDHWCIALMGDPNGHNHLQFRSLAREFRTPNDNPRLLGLYFARDLFPNLWQAFDTLPEFPPIAGHFSLVADYLVSLMKNLPNIRRTDAPAVAEMTRALLASAVSSTSDNLAQAAPAIDYLIKERARRYIYRNIGNAALTPNDICRAIGVSRSKLYLAFADSGGVSSFIKHTRLMKAFEEISTISTNMATISSIADKLAFPDAATFSRAFRSEFGVTPRDVRNAAIKGTKILPPAPKLTANDTFSQVLQQLRP